MSDWRIERDSMGEVRLPGGVYYGAQTQRAVENFPISGQTLPAEMIHQSLRFHSLLHGPVAVQTTLEIVPEDYVFGVQPAFAALVELEFSQIVRRRVDCLRTAAKQRHNRKQAT